MQPHPNATEIASAWPVIAIIGFTVIVTVAIAAWLVRDVAHRAIERTSPEKVPAVVMALGSFLHPLRLFLPWSSRPMSIAPTQLGADLSHDQTLHNEITAAATGDQR
jgi:hypothetical protein